MRQRRAAILVAAILAMGGAGCGLVARNPLDWFRPVKVAPAPPPVVVDDDDRLPWASREPYAVVVRKACRTLDVYHFGARIRSFPAVFGMNGRGGKLYEGDLRTPSGFYMIVDKRPHQRWRRFLLLDYPNLQDLNRYWMAVGTDEIPRRGKGYPGVGGAVGIHGTEDAGLNRRGVDWTLGCISLQNPDVEELASLVPVGTLVLIED